MISLSNNFVFVHIPKTGGNSLQLLLEPYSDDARCRVDEAHDLVDRFEIKGPITGAKHFSSRQYIDAIGLDRFLALRKVTFVRNPFDRAMSLYFARARRAATAAAADAFSTESFVRLVSRMRSASSFLSYQSRLLEFDFVGRFEQFAADVPLAVGICGVATPAAPLPHLNRGQEQDTRRYYDRATIEAVSRRFHVDFVNFGYPMNL